METSSISVPPWYRYAPWLKPYYLIVAALAGAITAGFFGFMLLLWIVVENFNPLGWME